MLRQLRDKRGLSQRDLAKQAGITGAYVAQLEGGLRVNPSLPVLRRLAKALKVELTDLLK